MVHIILVWSLDRQGNLGGDILSKLIRQSKIKTKMHHLTSHYDESRKNVLLKLKLDGFRDFFYKEINNNVGGIIRW